METACSRCHRTLLDEDLFCSGCGLPQLVFPPDGSSEQPTAEPWVEAVRDAGSVEWKSALRAALLVAVPAGLLCSELSALGGFSLFWMVAAAGWTVALYWRKQSPAWITVGAGARIGLVTGLIAAWVTFAISSATLFVERYLLHQADRIDGDWQTMMAAVLAQQKDFLSSVPQFDPAQVQAVNAQYRALLLSPEGHAGMVAFNLAVKAGFLLLFAMGGGVLGARMMNRKRRSQL